MKKVSNHVDTLSTTAPADEIFQDTFVSEKVSKDDLAKIVADKEWIEIEDDSGTIIIDTIIDQEELEEFDKKTRLVGSDGSDHEDEDHADDVAGGGRMNKEPPPPNHHLEVTAALGVIESYIQSKGMGKENSSHICALRYNIGAEFLSRPKNNPSITSFYGKKTPDKKK